MMLSSGINKATASRLNVATILSCYTLMMYSATPHIFKAYTLADIYKTDEYNGNVKIVYNMTLEMVGRMKSRKDPVVRKTMRIPDDRHAVCLGG